MPIKIHGKDYKTVAERVNEFRQTCEDHGIETKILKMEGEDCIIQAFVIDPEGRTIATGIAHEVKGSSNINKTSHVENCETSAIGRALAAFGLAGSEYASGDEVTTAIINQHVKEATEGLKEHVKAVFIHSQSIAAIKTGISEGNLSMAAEAWFELSDESKKELWLAPTKGGIFTTQEREAMQSQEFREAHYGSESN